MQRSDLVLENENWRTYKGHIVTGTLMTVGRRGSGGSAKYPGNFIPEIPRNEMLRFSKKGDLIADLFAGSETTADVADSLGRIFCGCDLRPLTIRTDHGDARNWDPGCEVQMVFLHPPYADIINYNEALNDPNQADFDLSLPWPKFLVEFKAVAENAYRMLTAGGHAVLVMGDLFQKGETIDLGFKTMEIMRTAGFKLKQITIKNFGNEVSNKGKNENLMYYRSLRDGSPVLEHEYVFILQKPAQKPKKVKALA